MFYIFIITILTGIDQWTKYCEFANYLGTDFSK